MALDTCINNVCTKSTQVAGALSQGQQNVTTWMNQAHSDLDAAKKQVQALLVMMAQEGRVLDCVINGPAGKTCTTARNVSHLTLAEALSRVNACTITAITEQDFVATAGQTAVVLGSTPASASALEVYVNGAACEDPSDYTLVGNTVTFVDPLTVGDTVSVRVFTP